MGFRYYSVRTVRVVTLSLDPWHSKSSGFENLLASMLFLFNDVNMSSVCQPITTGKHNFDVNAALPMTASQLIFHHNPHREALCVQ